MYAQVNKLDAVVTHRLLKEYEADGNLFLLRLVKEGVPSRLLGPLCVAARRIDAKKVADYFQKQGIEFDPEQPESVLLEIPAHFVDAWAGMFDMIRPLEDGERARLLKFDLNAPARKVAELVKEYEKAKKPELCEKIFAIKRIISGHELIQLLDGAQMLLELEKKEGASANFTNAVHEIREVVECFMLYYVKQHWGERIEPDSIMRALLNFAYNLMRTTKKLQEVMEKEGIDL